MRINTNSWNRLRYTLYTPFYDRVAKIFNTYRKKSIDSLKIEPGELVLLVGAGTGLDLKYIPFGSEITATDITPSMTRRIDKRNEKLEHNLESAVMDAQNLNLPDGTFDYIIMHLILAVLPDPKKAIKEAERVLKINGEIAVFDKFIAPGKKLTWKRKILNGITNFLFSDITRDIDTIIEDTNLIKISDKKAAMGGLFRMIKLRKISNK